MKLEKFEGRIKTSVLNFVLPGLGYYYNEKNELWIKLMMGYSLLTFVLIAFNEPGWLLLPFLINIATVIHPLSSHRVVTKMKDKEKILQEYVRETLKDIIKKIDKVYQKYIDLKAKMGDSNRDIEKLQHHLNSLKAHYNKARNNLNDGEYEKATDEATFAYKMLYNIQKDISELESKYNEFTLLK